MLIEERLGRARVVFTDRHGGVSSAPYDTANLSDRSADDASAVAENRDRLAHRVAVPLPDHWGWLRQVHSADVVVVDAPAAGEAPLGDAAVTACVALPLVVLVADCAPIALACDDAIGVVHAGWQGLLAGVVEHAVAELRAIGTGDVRALIGPCIHPARYEFGRRDLDRVVARLGRGVEARTDQGTPALDLPAGVRSALTRAGVTIVDDVDVCTATSVDHFSHRRDGETGRQALVAILDA